MSVCDIDFGLELKKAYEHGYADGKRDAAQWVSVKERLPKDFVSVLAHMTDAGEFPEVREAYAVCGMFFFPALHENHPVDYWAEMPKPPKEERECG